MQIESSNNSKDTDFSHSLKIEEENNVICKDGFCTLQNQNKNQMINKKNLNLFDPI